MRCLPARTECITLCTQDFADERVKVLGFLERFVRDDGLLSDWVHSRDREQFVSNCG